jgi:DNA (cytosine-5)-methyltransferase 1
VKLGSLFDGIGTFPLSASQYGIKPVWASEIEPFPIKVTQHHFPDMKHLGDITKVNGAEIEPVDVITFGSPCQDLSVAGKRAGLKGERSGLFSEAIRIIKEMRCATDDKYPRFAVWENVPGAYSSNKGQDFRAVLEEITETEIPMPASGKWATAGMVRTGNRDVAWRTLDAQHWGVPQRRKRIFLVADFGGQCASEILFVEQGVSGNLAESRKARQEAAATTGDGVDKSSQCLTPWDVQSRRIYREEGTWPALYGGEGGGRGYVATGYKDATDLILADQGGSQMSVSYGKSPTLRAQEHGHQPLICSVDCRNLRENKEISGTLQCKSTGGYSLNYQNPVRIGYAIRRLSPLECERLMGLPDNWTNVEGASDTARYKAIGNGIAKPCSDFVIGRIAEVLRRDA